MRFGKDFLEEEAIGAFGKKELRMHYHGTVLNCHHGDCAVFFRQEDLSVSMTTLDCMCDHSISYQRLHKHIHTYHRREQNNSYKK